MGLNFQFSVFSFQFSVVSGQCVPRARGWWWNRILPVSFIASALHEATVQFCGDSEFLD